MSQIRIGSHHDVPTEKDYQICMFFSLRWLFYHPVQLTRWPENLQRGFLLGEWAKYHRGMSQAFFHQWFHRGQHADKNSLRCGWGSYFSATKGEDLPEGRVDRWPLSVLCHNIKVKWPIWSALYWLSLFLSHPKNETMWYNSFWIIQNYLLYSGNSVSNPQINHEFQ